jgi:hypothetical protein
MGVGSASTTKNLKKNLGSTFCVFGFGLLVAKNQTGLKLCLGVTLT